MIINLTGQAGAGKTSISKELLKLISNSINIDGDELREILNNKDYSETGRRNNIKTAYHIALFLEKRGFTPIVSLISPYKDLREELKDRTEVFECYIFTSEIRGKENFFVEGYEKPEKYFLPVDTTKRNATDLAEEISVLIKNKIFKNIVANKQQNEL